MTGFVEYGEGGNMNNRSCVIIMIMVGSSNYLAGEDDGVEWQWCVGSTTVC